MRATLIAELATSHGGDMAVAEDMIRAAADAGCDYAKVQTYSLARLNPADPQAEWLRQAHLDREDHARLMKVCEQAGIKFLSTPFDADSLQLLRDLGQTTFKIASSESGQVWWQQIPARDTVFVSWPWGRKPEMRSTPPGMMHLTAIPLYPTPLECVGQATLLDGWSDHCEGIAACQWALAQGARIIEAHMCLPGRSRVTKFDKTPENLRELRDFADKMATIRTGVAAHFRERWTA